MNIIYRDYVVKYFKYRQLIYKYFIIIYCINRKVGGEENGGDMGKIRDDFVDYFLCDCDDKKPE